MAICGEGVRFLFLPFTREKKNMLMDGWEGGRTNDEDGMWLCLGLEIYT